MDENQNSEDQNRLTRIARKRIIMREGGLRTLLPPYYSRKRLETVLSNNVNL